MLVAIEGIDGTGKATQVRLVQELLTKAGLAVESLSFPQYEVTRSGRMLQAYLAGEMGPVPPVFASMLFAIDRAESQQQIRASLSRSDVVLVDRYVSSNIAHQCAREPDAGKRQELSAWIRSLEFGILGVIPPDLQILLLSTEATAADNRASRGGVEDMHERDANHQVDALRAFVALSQEPGWKTISTVSSGVQRAPGDIARDVFQTIMQAKVHLSGSDPAATVRGLMGAIFGPNSVTGDPERLHTRMQAAQRALLYFRNLGKGNTPEDDLI